MMKLLSVFLVLAGLICQCKLRVIEDGADTLTVPPHTMSWAIAITAIGKVAHMHVRMTDENEAINVVAYLKPTRKRLLKEKTFTSQVRKDYSADDGMFNGFTLPPRLSWSAAQHNMKLNKINELLGKVAASERALVALGTSIYQGFSKLHVATNDGYRFENLAEKIEVKFAGKRFFNRHTVAEVIKQRHTILQNEKIFYKQRQKEVRLNQKVLNEAEAAYHAVLTQQPLSASVTIKKPALNFHAQAENDADFVELIENLAHLKQARLLLAEKILSLYKPFKMTFFHEKAFKEPMVLTFFPDDERSKADKRNKDVAFRYKVYTTTIKRNKEYLLGQVEFDTNFHIKKIQLSLKPLGGLWRTAKLTATLCHAEKKPLCPIPIFEP